MGMTKNQLELIEYVARNDLKKAKQAALACCAEDTTQKNHREIRYCENLLNSKGLNMVELPVKNFCFLHDGRFVHDFSGKSVLFDRRGR